MEVDTDVVVAVVVAVEAEVEVAIDVEVDAVTVATTIVDVRIEVTGVGSTEVVLVVVRVSRCARLSDNDRLGLRLRNLDASNASISS